MVMAYEVGYQTDDSVLETAIAVGENLSYFVVVSVPVTYVIMEAGRMIAEKFLQRERAKGREEGRQVGREEGRQEGRQVGREVGREEERRVWIAWAQQSGLPIDELPLPSSQASQDTGRTSPRR
jgi:hypothetical protein